MSQAIQDIDMKLDKNCLSCHSIPGCVDILDCNNLRRFGGGDMIYASGDEQDGIWQVLRGYVALRVYTQAGDVVLLRMVRRGGVFGFRSFLTAEPRSCCAQALGPVELKHVPASLLSRMMEREPRLTHALQLTMANAVSDAHERILRLATQNTRAKFLRLCAELAEAEGIAAPASGYSVRLPIPYQDIAQILSISPETMSRTARRLQDDGIIIMTGRNITVAAGWMACCESNGG